MIRTILIPDTQTVFFEVPKDYIGKEIEVIAFAKQEYMETVVLPKSNVSFLAASIDTRDFKFNRNEANDR